MTRIRLRLSKATQFGLFGEHKEVLEPGKRGGKFYRTETNKVRYGEKPVPEAPTPPAPPPPPAPAPAATPATDWLKARNVIRREKVFGIMRELDQQVQRGYDAARIEYGAVAVGGGHIDGLMRAAGVDELLRRVRKGFSPTEALPFAQAEAARVADKWKAQRPKDYDTHRWPQGQDDYLKGIAKRLEDAGTPPQRFTEEERAQRRALYEERVEQRRDRLEGRAARLRSESAASFNRAHQISERFAGGQPIILGHHSTKRALRDREKADDAMRRGIERQKEAAGAAGAAFGVGTAGISLADPDAPEKLTAKAESDEARLAEMKRINAAYKKLQSAAVKAGVPHKPVWAGKNPAGQDVYKPVLEVEEKLKLLMQIPMSDAWRKRALRNIASEYTWEQQPFPPYVITNLSAKVRNTKKRAAEVEEEQATWSDTPETLASHAEFEVTTEPDNLKVVFKFAKRNPRDIHLLMRSHGFVWSPTRSAYVRTLNASGRANAMHLAKILPEKLGAPVAKAGRLGGYIHDPTPSLGEIADHLPVQAPGSRGGRYYVTPSGQIRYGAPPAHGPRVGALRHYDAARLRAQFRPLPDDWHWPTQEIARNYVGVFTVNGQPIGLVERVTEDTVRILQTAYGKVVGEIPVDIPLSEMTVLSGGPHPTLSWRPIPLPSSPHHGEFSPERVIRHNLMALHA